jgi:hypothetical protein
MADGTGAAPAADAGGAAAATTGDAGAAAQGGTPAAGAGTAAVTAQPAAEAPWHGELTTEDIGWLQNKGWFGTELAKADTRKSFPAMVKANRGLETILGRNRIAAPKDAADTEGWNAFYAAGGRPASWQAYDLKAPEGGDQALTDAIAEMAHTEGLSTRQLNAMATKLSALGNERQAAQQAADDQAFNTNSHHELEGLRTEWGNGADAKFAAGQRAARTFGIDKAVMSKMERAIGTKTFLTVMANMGAAISEDAGAGGSSTHTGAMTLEMAKARLGELSKDTAWQAKLQAGDADAVALKRQIDETMAAALG